MATRSLLLAAGAALVTGGSVSSAEPLSKGPPPCREGALVSLRSGKVVRRFSARVSGVGSGYDTGPLIPGAAAASDGRGGWFAAGLGVRRMRHDGALKRDWHAQVGERRAIAEILRVRDILYVHDGYRVFALSARTGRRLWVSQRAHQGPRIGILAMAATPTVVYIGGYLTRVGVARRRQLAALDARTGRLLSWRAPPLKLYRGSTPVVWAIALSATRLYFGGSFRWVGRASREDGVAAVRLSDGTLTSFTPKARIWNLGSLVVAGRWVLIGGPEGGGVFNARSGTARAGMRPLSAASAITVHGSTVYLGGNLRTSIGAHNLLAMDLRSGKLKDWRPKLARYVSVGGIAISGDRAFVGGQFCSRLS